MAPPVLRRPTFAYLCASLHTGSGPEVWRGVQDAAEELDVNVLAFPGGRLGGREDFESLRNRLYALPAAPTIDGVLSWASSLSGVRGLADQVILHRRFDQLPLVTLADRLPGRPCVRFDVTSGMNELMDHLIEVHGYRRFAFVRGPEAHQSAQDRFQAFHDSLRRHGLAASPELVTAPWGWNQGREALVELLDGRGKVPGRDFEVVVTASDLLAFAVLRDLQTRGFRVPSDIAVVGFNDSQESRIANPPLTTVHLPFGTQAAEGLRRLYDQWRGETVPSDTLLPTRLVLRQSCACRSRELERSVSAHGSPGFADLGLSSSDIQAWVQPLEDALLLSEPDQRDRRFLDRLERVLEQVNSTRFPVSLWQDVLSELRRGRSNLDRGLEDLFGQARILVGEAAVREFSFRQWQRDQKDEQVRALARSLQGAPDPRRLSEVLTRRLPDLGFAGGWLVRHDGASDRAVLLGSFTEHGRVDLPADGLDFPVVSLLPAGTWPDRRRTLVVEPLFYREQFLGYLVLEANGGRPEVYEELRSAVSTALQTSLQLAAESTAPQERLLDPAALLRPVRWAFPPGLDRLPYSLGDPAVVAAFAASVGEQPVRLVWEGAALRLDGPEGRRCRLPFPTLGGETGSFDGDRLVVFSEVSVKAEVVRALEEATALAVSVVNPVTAPWEAYAAFRPPLGVVDLATAGEATFRTLGLLANDPGWRSVPFVVFPRPGSALALRGARSVLDLLSIVHPVEQGIRVLFVGTAPPPGRHPGLAFRTVVSGLQAVPLLQQEGADLVVAASGGGGFQGLDLVEFLASDPHLASVRVLVLADGMRPEAWARLESSPQVAVQLDGVWSPEELVAFLGVLACRTTDPSPRVKRALAWLAAHHSREVSRWQLAEYLAVSEDHLTREFRRELGLTPWEFLTRYRIRQARRALESGTLRVDQIAREVGYRDLSYFCRVFKAETGTTPQKYRDTVKRLPPLAPATTSLGADPPGPPL